MADPAGWTRSLGVEGTDRGRDAPESTGPTRGVVAPLYGAGFVTAFGAHAVAAGLGTRAGPEGLSLLGLGVVLAVCDGAEVLLKPVFGTVADRWGPRRVLLGGLVL